MPSTLPASKKAFIAVMKAITNPLCLTLTWCDDEATFGRAGQEVTTMIDRLVETHPRGRSIVALAYPAGRVGPELHYDIVLTDDFEFSSALFKELIQGDMREIGFRSSRTLGVVAEYVLRCSRARWPGGFMMYN